jgi:hypothetical protein
MQMHGGVNHVIMDMFLVRRIQLNDTKKEIQKIIKPRIFVGIIGTLVLLAPYFNIMFSIYTNSYDKDFRISLWLTLPSLILLGAYWCWHIIRILNIERDIKEIEDLFSDQDEG